jgi:hypothetical protein
MATQPLCDVRATTPETSLPNILTSPIAYSRSDNEKDNVNADVRGRSDKRDLVRISGAIVLIALVSIIALELRFFVSLQVLLIVLIGEVLLCCATRASLIALSVVVSVTLVVGVTLLESDNYVQYGTLKLWGPPTSITMCGITRHFDGVVERLESGVGPAVLKITTTPSGLVVYGTRGCPEVPLYVQDRSSYLRYQ